MVLWLLVWGGYNTGIELVLSPGFPTSTMELFHGVRAFFPILAAWIALLAILSRGSLRTQAVAGPLGLLGFFAAIGIVSSGLISRLPLRALYWVAMYEAVVVVLVAVCTSSDAQHILSRLITLNWTIDIVIMVGLLAAIPSFGGAALVSTQGSPLGVMAYNGSVGSHGTILGMASTRNTGFARYAGVAAVVALARLWQGKKWNKLIWIGVMLVALYALVLAQARTETLSFLVGSLVILLLRKRRRVALLGMGVLGVILLGLVGFFQNLWSFGTRNGGFDPTLTGRTAEWMQGLAAFWQSPWVGLGFQADRYYLHGVQLENSFLHALIQTGILGTLAYIVAYILTWYLMVRLYLSPRSGELPDEIPGILAFFTVFSITESISYYSAAFLLLAPVLAYIQIVAWQEGFLKGRRSYSRNSMVRVGRREFAFNSSEAAEGN
jgi:O-antigen ligase